jgi:aminopeptidase
MGAKARSGIPGCIPRMLPEYEPGARNAVRTCLAVSERDRVAIVTDREHDRIAEAVREEAAGTGAEVCSWAIEDYAQRPVHELPARLAQKIQAYKPTASYFIASSLLGEIAFRMPLMDLLIHTLGCRHGHMVGIDHKLMLQGMAADYDEIYRVTRQVFEAVKPAALIEVQTRLGTDLVASFSPSLRWVPADGRYHEPGRWGNLPEGEVFTAPQSVDGLLVAEELGDHFAGRYGLLENPVRFRIKGGRVLAIECNDAQLKSEVEAYLARHPESSRAGEFAIGTNVALTEITGNFLQDEKFPGVHIAFGDPYPHETGADWSCPTHVDALASRATVTVDGRRLMEDGRFLI